MLKSGGDFPMEYFARVGKKRLRKVKGELCVEHC